MPRNITDSQGVQYGESSLNPIEASLVSLQGVNFQGNIDNLKEHLMLHYQQEMRLMIQTQQNNRCCIIRNCNRCTGW